MIGVASGVAPVVTAGSRMGFGRNVENAPNVEEFGATILFAGNLEGVSQTMPLAIYLGDRKSVV